jgi:hypothetical protein
MTRPVMDDEAVAEDVFSAYQAIQLTPEQKAEARKRAEERAAEASRAGVYDRVLEIEGTVKWSIPWQALRIEE